MNEYFTLFVFLLFSSAFLPHIVTELNIWWIQSFQESTELCKTSEWVLVNEDEMKGVLEPKLYYYTKGKIPDIMSNISKLTNQPF